MIQMVSWLPRLAAIISVPALIASCLLWYHGHWVTAIPVSFLTFVAGSIAYTGYVVKKKIGDVADAAIDVAGKQAERITDAVVERVKKS